MKIKNAKCELLHLLLTNDNVTTRQIQRECFILNVTSYLTHLRRDGVNIVCDYVKTKNRFGRPVKYGKFSILNRRESRQIFEKLNK